MTAPFLLYARLRGRAGWNLLTRSGLPLPVAGGLALLGAGTAVQFALLFGRALGDVHAGSPADFAAALSPLLAGVQLVFAFVVVGSVSVRMFDPRKAAELDVFAALPLRRLDRFLIQSSDVALVPLAILATSILPAFAIAAARGAFSLSSAIVFLAGAALVCFQPVPALIAAYAFVLRAAPPRALNNRALLFGAFALAVLPLVPVLSGLLAAWRYRLPAPAWLPAGWAARAVAAADAGHAGTAVALLAACAALTLALCLLAWAAFDRVLLEHFDEILARLAVAPPPEDADRVTGRARASSHLARGAGAMRLREALARKEILALARDPALQLTMSALGASAATFALVGGPELGPMATAATGFLAVYMAACLGLATFSQEGRGFPVIAPLPLSAGEVLRAKLVVNTAMLALAGAAGGFFLGLSVPEHGWLVATPLLTVLGALTALPLGGLVTAMGALFPRKLLRTGRREISAQAMSFFTALTLLFYASVAAALAAPLFLGPACLFLPPLVIAAWAFLAAALVAAAKKAVRRGRTEG